ncbi:MAG: ABC transporter permease [Chloroflexi bacterium]|nr:ABC transporter permease [Chloroflexota bacterium]
MQRYVLRRILQGIPVLFIVSLIVFLALNLLPGDPVMARQGTMVGPGYAEIVAELRQQMGLDRPIHERYIRWLGGALRGDLGVSYITQQPVMKLIGQKLPATIELTIIAFLIALVLAVPAAILSVVKRGSWFDWAVTGFVTAGMAIPSFWLGIMLMLLFSVRLGWLPAVGYEPLFRDPAANLRHIVLPATTLGLIVAAPIMRVLRSSLLEVMRQDFVTVARAKGIAETAVMGRHVVRNALLSLVTFVGLQFGALISGAVIIEWIFAWPGMGWLTVDAVFNRDYTVVQGAVTLAACAFVAINIVIDLLYAALDPRVKHAG